MGYIAYEGPSRLNKEEKIVVIVTGVGSRKSDRSSNEKTGEMAQVWILLADTHPIEAISDGSDEAICGSCVLRGVLEENKDGSTTNRMRSCYVEVQNAPRAIWQSYQDGNYEPLTDDVTWPTQSTRLGAYGDPSSAPFAINKDLVSRGNGKQTGYTHQHSDRKFHPMRKLVMASVHSEDEAKELHAKGWRTFRTMSEWELPMANELICPASEEEGKRLTCEECLACSGTGLKDSRRNAMSVAIRAHGSPSKLSSYKKAMN